MSLDMDLIGLELSELSALESENLPYLTVFTLASGHNIYVHKVSNEFDYGSN